MGLKSFYLKFMAEVILQYGFFPMTVLQYQDMGMGVLQYLNIQSLDQVLNRDLITLNRREKNEIHISIISTPLKMFLLHSLPLK